MCIICFNSYFQHRLSSEISLQILQDIASPISNECIGSDRFLTAIETISTRLTELGFTITEPEASEVDSDESWNTDDEPNLLDGYDESTDNVIFINIRQMILESTKNKTILLRPDIVAASLIEPFPDKDEVLSRVTRLCSSYLLPLTYRETFRINEIFNAIPFYHSFRLNIIKRALKILNMCPSEFKRTSERSIELTQEAFKFDIINEDCQLCYEKLSEGTLYCSGRFDNNCQHKFCYSCYRQLQSTLLGDHCPSCRSPIKEKFLIRKIRNKV